MTSSKKLCAVAGLLALAACDMQVDVDETNNMAEDAGASQPATAEVAGNMVSIDAPGVDIKVALPAGIKTGVNVESDSDLIYPGSTLSGVRIAAGEGQSDGRVEVRFTHGDAPDEIAAWYRDAAGQSFTIDSATPQGNGFVIAGHETDDNSAFTITLDPKDGGGTEGRLSVSESR